MYELWWNQLPEHCKKCYYRGRPQSPSCDYYLRTGERRGCDPMHCTRFKSKSSVYKEADRILWRAGVNPRTEPSRAVQVLYDSGFPDQRISEITGLSRTYVYKWRKEHGLKANRERGGKG